MKKTINRIIGIVIIEVGFTGLSLGMLAAVATIGA